MSEQMRAFALFVLGAVLFVLALETEAFARPVTGVDRVMLCSAFFGVPYLFWEFTRRINWLIVLYLAVLVSVYFYLAYLAAGAVAGQMNASNAAIPAGVAGGLVGGAFCLFTLTLGRLAGPGATTRNALLGTAALTVVGGLGAFLASGGEVSPTWALFLPWQIVLGWFISIMLRVSPKKGETAA
ncbi:MAG TPA: hypothetical protein VLK25_13135 [Allosphingosinicella sp.]|nr:hypothetical protein [Allosphingosinicella sp.]